MSIDVIYVDLDGVLADFDRGYTEMFGVSRSDTRYNHSFDNYFDKFIQNSGFEKLEPMNDANVLFWFLETLKIPKEILSSTARATNAHLIAPQKRRWLKRQDINYGANFVPGKRHKHIFATPNAIIIDDTKSVITDWIDAGGIGIHHIDAEKTIAELKKYI